ncbi:pirin family protein [Neptuniibacter sp. CAU 1671]|uniref:pirin family protein n=1 Tax=Neptuniibacter sp. CAU 1671 TaxID=3032593 RepID=UPI0023DC0D9A|nr:pirin family protein [Neptuniibacter sp. CAU 1671]MDF2181156.1 pirin family protein [Neptuniibacter sp. CAU 1671]
MTQLREITRIIPGRATSDGAGVRLMRSLGQNPATRADPFLMLDAFSSDNPDDYIAGFPPHPHRGFETVTYMLDGRMLHKDHMGNEGLLRAGGVQWMTAGRGVIHEERPQQEQGLMRGFQLWVNLPAAEKMKPAAYQNIEPEDLVQIDLPGQAALKLIAGDIELQGQHYIGPVSGVSADPLMLDIQLEPMQTLQLPVPDGHQAVLYPFEGLLTVSGKKLEANQAAVLGQGDSVVLSSGAEGGRALLLAARPIGEEVAQYGPFVMNTMDELEQAIQDYRDGRLTG